MDQIRADLLKEIFNTSSDKYTLIFTSGATQGFKIVAENFKFTPGQSTFAYLSENHTSVVGMREIVKITGAKIKSFHEHIEHLNGLLEAKVPNLVAFPAMSNFCGQKFPLSWIEKLKNKSGADCLVLLDAAALVSTCKLDLKKFSPDFVCLSFYKLFGYPTGLGALIVKNESFQYLKKHYFGGGTVEMHLVDECFHVPKTSTAYFFEDGTLPFLEIISLKYGLMFLSNFPGGMQTITEHTFNLARYCHNKLAKLQHFNSQKLVRIHCSNDFTNSTFQGPIVNFNLIKANGEEYGYASFIRLVKLTKMILRTGCFCNIGACQKYLGQSDDEFMNNFQHGHVCGDDIDLIKGKPVGSIRVSFGLYSQKDDIDALLKLLKDNFIQSAENTIQNGQSLSSVQSVISSITVYPIKSCGPMKVEKWSVGMTGLEYDRKWAIVKKNVCQTQKHIRSLFEIRPYLNIDKNTLTLSYPCMDNLILAMEANGGDTTQVFKCKASVCGDPIEGYDCGDQVATWLELALGEGDLRLVKFASRQSKKKNGNTKLSLVNSGQFLVLNQSSATEIMDLVAKQTSFQDRGAEWVSDQFRCNIVINGCDSFSEENWKSLKIGSLRLIFNEMCRRCNIIGIDQKTGEDVEELKLVLSRMAERNFCFGVLMNMTNHETSDPVTISVGDPVMINSNE